LIYGGFSNFSNETFENFVTQKAFNKDYIQYPFTLFRHTSAGEYYNYLISKEIIKEKSHGKEVVNHGFFHMEVFPLEEQPNVFFTSHIISKIIHL